MKLVSATEREHGDRLIAVLIPEIVKEHWWQYLLHSYRVRRVRSCLLRYGGSRLLRYGGSRIVVIDVPWYMDEPRPEQGLDPEEAADKTGKMSTDLAARVEPREKPPHRRVG